jgi:hypothetical protein
MTKPKFAIIHNLEGLDKDALNQYLRDASVYFGLDPDLNGLDTIWMNAEDGTGLRKLTIYARRGTTDLLREIHGINVKEMNQIDIPGTVTFRAIGLNKAGRQEIAIGSCGTEGLRGQRLADATMTAETRAGRRLTLKFVGAGILDVSEVTTQTTDIGQAASSGALPIGIPVVMPPPQVSVSTQPGKDITPAAPRAGEPGFDMEGQIKKVYEEGAKALAETPSSVVAASNEVTLPPAPPTGMNITETPVEEKKKRTRRSRNTVSIASPGQSTEPVQTEMPTANLDKEGKLTPISVPPATANEPEQGANGNRSQLYPALAEPVKVEYHVTSVPATLPAHCGSTLKVVDAPTEPSKPATPVLSAEKQKEYRERLGKYSQDILPRAGLMPSDGIGGVTMKLRAFGRLHTGAEVAKFTEEQFEDLLSFLDGYVQQNGAPALVQYIDKALGVIK